MWLLARAAPSTPFAAAEPEQEVQALSSQASSAGPLGALGSAVAAAAAAVPDEDDLGPLGGRGPCNPFKRESAAGVLCAGLVHAPQQAQLLSQAVRCAVAPAEQSAPDPRGLAVACVMCTLNNAEAFLPAPFPTRAPERFYIGESRQRVRLRQRSLLS